MSLICQALASVERKWVRLLPDSRVYGANMGPTGVLSTPGWLHAGPVNLAIGVYMVLCRIQALQNWVTNDLNNCLLLKRYDDIIEIDDDPDSKVNVANMGPPWTLL